MKKKYCKICGLELERNVCSSYSHEINEKNEKRVCSSCKKVIDDDSKYCPYCGIPTYGSVDNGALKEELKGNFAKDVIVHYGIKKVKKEKNKVPFILLLIIVLLGIALYVVKYTDLLPESNIFMLGEDEDSFDVEDVEKEDNEDVVYNEEKETGRKVDFEKEEIIDKDVETIKEIKEEVSSKKEDKLVEDEKSVIEEVVEKDLIINTTKDDINNYISDTISPTAGADKKTIDLENGGTIKNIDKTKEFYVVDLIEIIDNRFANGKECEITYYLPILKGKNASLTSQINESLKNAFYGDLKNIINEHVSSFTTLPKEVFIDTVELRTVNNKQLNFILSGTVTPYDGVYEKCKFRVLYKRANGAFEIKNITE